MDWLIKDSAHIWQGIISSFFILATVIAVVRIAGIRTFSKMTSFDFAVTVATGSIMGSTATGSTTLVQGAVAVSALVACQAFYAFAKRRSPVADRIISNQPLLLMDGPEILDENLASVRMDREELTSKLRAANVLRLEDVRAVVLETTGDVSVLQGDPNGEMDALIMRGVRRRP